jgi:hypothetical protein
MYKNKYVARIEIASKDELENINYNYLFKRYVDLKEYDRLVIFYKLFGALEVEQDLTFFSELDRLVSAQERRNKNDKKA